METFANRCLRWAAYSRFRPVQECAWKRIAPKGRVFSPSDSAVRVLVGGDVSLDLEVRTPRDTHVFRSQGVTYRLGEEPDGYWVWTKMRHKFWSILCRSCFSPRLFSAKIINVPFQEPRVKGPENEKRRSVRRDTRTRFNVDCSSARSKFAYPFESIAPFLRARDLVLVNLETPLTGHPRVRGFFRSDPGYAQAMKDAGISIVSVANNHIFDAGEIGFLHTLDHLKEAGIPYTGAGRNFEDARLGRLLQLNGMTLAFLSYTQFCNAGFASIAAEYPGTLPLDQELVVEDIKAAREKADLVLVSVHWGLVSQPNVHPKQVEIAHSLIDAGADVLIGHHSHVPHGIEVYKKRPILYSLGNFIFGYARPEWSDNYLADIVIDRGRIQGLMIYPISGQGQELFQPQVLSGARADSLLHELQIKSAMFGTGIAVQNHIGYVAIGEQK